MVRGGLCYRGNRRAGGLSGEAEEGHFFPGTKKPAEAGFFVVPKQCLFSNYVGSLRTFRALLDLEGNLLTLGQGFEA